MPLQIYNTTRRELAESVLTEVVTTVLQEEGFLIESLVAVYCGNKMIHRINREFLGHDYPTDTITFSYSKGSEIDGEFYISLDAVEENALRYKVGFDEELMRVTIHSALHLAGYQDGKDEERVQMQEKEALYLKRFVTPST
ncbi:rRNA maturation RNase YbeY [Chlorobium phaeobacteroides]|jgi:rRNA maturation RNase YbeY|nr:rRNA maturation RNase YbeY [Chlorobium phaeobacteroides]MBV5326116.1 rRNA maturation RNase YbeY [Chlorobium sp.]